MRDVVKLDGGDDSGGPDIGDDKIDVLLRDAVGVAAPPIAVAARDDVCESDLAGNQIAIPNDISEDTEKRRLIHGQQEMSRSKDRAW